MSLAARELIRQKCDSVVESYLFTQAKQVNWASSLTNLARVTAQEYEDRFLIELIQNAYDVHDPTRTDGHICIHFARSEGVFGTLYIANGGKPFNKSNFHAICEIAQSDKEPGAGIGNKGVGFKSVLQVCDSPEIYSISPDPQQNAHRPGFCFRFAQEDDYADLCNGDATILETFKRDVSPYFLPIHIPHIPKKIKDFFEGGMVTVIRMPLSREPARTVATNQLEQLRASPVPVLLFLPRISRLVIEEQGDDGIAATTVIRRTPEPIKAPTPHHRWSKVTIGRTEIDADGEQDNPPRSFFLATKTVDQQRLADAIEQSISENSLDQRFAEWTEEAAVSVAVQLGEDTPADCRLYTFLPMGKEAQSPFGGHLNAPFAPNLARTHVNRSIPLNALLFEVAAELAVDTVVSLSENDSHIEEEVLLDVLTWGKRDVELLSKAFATRNVSLADHPLLRLVPVSGLERRGSISETYSWGHDRRVFSAPNLRRITKLPFLAAVDGERRYARLRDLFASIDHTLDPEDETVAEWAESVAQDLLECTPAESWSAFYSELADIFAKSGKALEGRKILLDSSQQLRHAGPFRGSDRVADRPAVFFPPTTERSEDDEDVESTHDVAIPDHLQKYLCYMHDELAWYERDGAIQRRTAARAFLQEAHLVQRFDTRSLVEQCSRISQSTKSLTIRKSALLLAFNLQRAARSRDALKLENLAFYVPTTSGWRLAADSLFSKQWSTARGAQLAMLIAHAHSVSDDIAALQDQLILAPERSPFSDAPIEEWSAFLSRIGVRDGLWPAAMLLATREYRGEDVTIDQIGRALKMPADAVEQWSRTHTSSQAASHPYTEYRVQTPFFRLPGQFEYSQFPEAAKRIYARLVFAQIGMWKHEHLSAKIERPRSSGKDTLQWPTPVVAFLRYGDWIPTQNAIAEQYVAPHLAWHFDEREGDIAPSFLPLIPRDLRRELEQSHSSVSRLIEEGRLRRVGRDEDSSALVALLGTLIADDRIGESEFVSFRKLYRQAWETLLTAAPSHMSSLITSEQVILAVTRGSEPVALKIRDHGANCCTDTLYIVDTDEHLRMQLLGDLRFTLMDVGAKNGDQVIEALTPILGDNIRPSSLVELEVLVDDDQVVSASAEWPLLIDDGLAWMKMLIGLVIQLKSSVPSHHTANAQSQVQKRLSLLRVCKGSKVRLRVDRVDAELPSFVHNVVLVDDVDHPTIVIGGNHEAWTWDVLDRIASAISTAVNRRSVQADLQLAILRLSRVAAVPEPIEPSVEEYADALSISVDEVNAILRELRSHELSILEFLFPVMHHILGADDAAEFDPSCSTFTCRDEIREALVSHQVRLPVTVQDLLEHCATAPTLEQLRVALTLDFAAFNSTLKDIGRPYKPTHNVNGHHDEFAFFIQTHAHAIVSRIRNRFLQEFRDGNALDGYVAVRDLNGLHPDPSWLDTWLLPSEELMQEEVDDWLRGFSAEPLDLPVPDLPALEMVRTENRKQIRRIAEKLLAVIPAWSAKNGTVTPVVWTDHSSVGALADRMFDEGATDFEVLPPHRIFLWLEQQKLLPVDMPHSTDPSALGLTDEDLERTESEAEKRRREQELRRRTIEIGGKRFGSSPDQCDALIDAIKDSISEKFLKCPKQVSRLDPIAASGKRKRGGKTGGTAGSRGRITDEQKHATGLVGEILAFEWLKRHYDGVTESCWKSKYRDLVFGGAVGDDSLGYDFEVHLRKGSYKFEVKATTGTDCVIELGATELETSQRHARSTQYRILFIPNVLDADRRRIIVLPNPFSTQGRGMFQASGTGIRFRFAID